MSESSDSLPVTAQRPEPPETQSPIAVLAHVQFKKGNQLSERRVKEQRRTVFERCKKLVDDFLKIETRLKNNPGQLMVAHEVT